jgi:serine/threonine protein kinase
MSNEGASRRIGSTLGRFKLLRCIGAGGMGVVYEAESLERPERVALKTLNHLNADAIYRFKHEFRSLAGVLHPNLVQMHELSCDGPNWFFVMDYVDGVPFIEYVRGARTLSESRLASTIDVRGRYDRRPSDAPESVSDSSSGAPALPERTPNPPAFYVRLRRALGELVSGVNALHALGKIHRDLKPSNVLVTAEGRVVVLDFGLTSEEVPEDVSSTRDGALRGTPLYMAPEMFTGGGVGKAADFYAVGVMLYEALVGELPHRGAVHQLVSQKLFTRPVSPRELVPETPEDLSEIALSLLAREPEQRPLDRLSAFYERTWRAHLTADFVQPEGDLSGYPLLLVPSLYLTTPAAAANLAAYVQGGGTLVVSYFSGIVDEHDTIHPGAHPGALRDLLGLEVEEFLPLRAGERVGLERGLSADVWTERLVLTGAEPVLRYTSGPAAGGAAVTRHRVGRGVAWYVSTRLAGLDLDVVLREAGMVGRDEVPDGVEVVRRVGDSTSYLLAINHTDRDVDLPGVGKELLTGTPCHGTLPVPAGAVRVLRSAG